MTIAWYGHLKFKSFYWGKNLDQLSIIVSLALFYYLFQVPANEAGFKENGGPFSLVQLKTIQQAITLIAFMAFNLSFLKDEKLG